MKRKTIAKRTKIQIQLGKQITHRERDVFLPRARRKQKTPHANPPPTRSDWDI